MRLQFIGMKVAADPHAEHKIGEFKDSYLESKAIVPSQTRLIYLPLGRVCMPLCLQAHLFICECLFSAY